MYINLLLILAHVSCIAFSGGRKTMLIHRSQEELQALWNSFQTDLNRERVATSLANAPTFSITHPHKNN